MIFKDETSSLHEFICHFDRKYSEIYRIYRKSNITLTFSLNKLFKNNGYSFI